MATRAEVRAAPNNEAEFRLDLTAAVPVEIAALVHPDRVVIDLPDVGLRLDPVVVGAGFVTGIQYEAMADHRARIVITAAEPVTVASAALVAMPSARHGVQLVIALARATPGSDARAGAAGERAALVKPAAFDASQPTRGVPSRPVIMIDPGHGGIDPGAVGRNNTTEKAIVLSVARELRAALSATGRYDVRLTRSDDIFIPLDSRVEQSVQAKADLFISLHADAIDDGSMARSIHGASIYTLSEKASDEQARLMADKENAADLAAGVDAATVDGGEGIKGILYDLMNRETVAFSHLLSRSIAEAVGKTGGLAREPERAAAFRVLKQAHAPSVLIELGFLSNPDEEQRMTEAWWQKQTARQLAGAVDAYFAQRPAADGQRLAQPSASRLPP